MPLTIKVSSKEFYDEKNQKFINVKDTVLTLEHSLVSLHKWEQKWKKPFLKENVFKELGPESFLDYIKCMCMTKNVDDYVFYALSEENLKEISDYINDPMTATWFAEDKNDKNDKKKHPKRNNVDTAEVIYWKMIALQIPKEFEKWHLSSLLTLIRVCSVKNDEEYKKSQNGSKSKKVGTEGLRNRAALNAKRRASMHTSG